jgi:hypothetical protein
MTSWVELNIQADRAAIAAFRDIMPKQAARLLSFGVRPKYADRRSDSLTGAVMC